MAGTGDRPIDQVEPHELLAVLKRQEAQGNLETARRTRAFASRVFRYAVATARAKADPAALLLGAVASPRPKNLSAIVDPRRVGELLRAIDSYTGQPSTQLALALSPHVFVRPGELRQAGWDEFELGTKIWRIPAARMKKRRLAECLATSDGHVDPAILRYLVKLIRGNRHETGRRLTLVRRPGLAPRELTREEEFEAAKLDMKMAVFIAELDGFARGKGKEAFYQASVEFNLAINYIRARVKPYKRLAIQKVAALANMRLQSQILIAQNLHEKALKPDIRSDS